MTKGEILKAHKMLVEILANYDQQKVIVAKGIRQAVACLHAEDPDPRRYTFQEMRKEREKVRARRREAIPFLLAMADVLEGKTNGEAEVKANSLPE